MDVALNQSQALQRGGLFTGSEILVAEIEIRARDGQFFKTWVQKEAREDASGLPVAGLFTVAVYRQALQ